MDAFRRGLVSCWFLVGFRFADSENVDVRFAIGSTLFGLLDMLDLLVGRFRVL